MATILLLDVPNKNIIINNNKPFLLAAGEDCGSISVGLVLIPFTGSDVEWPLGDGTGSRVGVDQWTRHTP